MSATQHANELLTEYRLMQIKRDNQRAKARARMAKYRLKLKELPLDEQEAINARARHARRRYRESHREQWRQTEAAMVQYAALHMLQPVNHDACTCQRPRTPPLVQKWEEGSGHS
ncbi:hypothetical protein C8R43DRAFT_1124243 [Mycena crocata]|nr:hypothetical protein C8R43DRAFT_1124243 [Mycena crocata]